MARRIDLFYDVISPYSWVAFETLCALRNKWNLTLNLKPFSLGFVMHNSGNKPPMMVPAKGVYMKLDLERLRNFYGIPLKLPEDVVEAMLKKGSLNAMRFLCSLQAKAPDYLESASRELWMRRWSRDQDIHLTQHFLEVCRAINLPIVTAEDVVAKIEHVATKETLKNNTEEALSAGAFGAPWIHVYKNDDTMEAFFGSDRMELIASTLGIPYTGVPVKEIKSKM